ncbi:uncharacterized protein LOC122878302 isoform X2 [Siniperca chuatsi]|uniref:uncharacterized protein LOC122878302 isoform X2 n=1 Tax=Siniperca chuatsi TaxID=119488 RepID=UPI001CE1C8EF|nr:uncharacterized protein LOC122878302 isoform X2 [Siniperca chuatsi]
MGNVLKTGHGFGQTLMTRASVKTWKSEPEVVQEDLLLSELSGLQEVELWRVHWCLSQAVLQDFPPIPPLWLQSAQSDHAISITKTMLKCYHEEGALTMLAAVLTMIGRDDRVCHLHHTADPPRPRLTPKRDPDFVKTQRRKLISMMQWPDAVLDALQDYRILNTANREAVDIYAVRRDKNRALVDLVLRKGDEAQEAFYQALSQSEPFLLQELEDDPILDKNPSETSVLTEMLELLVSDELRSFQWLVSDHMTGGSRPCVGGEQLERADRPTTQRLLRQHFGPKQAERVAKDVLLKIVPTLTVCLRGDAVISQSSSDIRVETNADTVVEITPEVLDDGNMFRLRCWKSGVFRCSVTGLQLEGFGDVVYETVPWDVNFLSSKGLRPAGPLFRFTKLTGSFHRLHLPHCQLLSDGGQHFLSVAHVTGDSVDFITPGQVTEDHAIVDVSGFSCFGLVMSAAPGTAIRGIVLLFSVLNDCSLFVLLLPRNVCIAQVMKEWKRRIRAEYVETIHDCELIPNQTYKLSGEPVTFIQPESSKFVNFSDYNNFLPSFQVQLAAGVRRVELQLMSHVAPLRLIGWLFGSTESVVWSQVVHLRVCVSESDVTLLLLNTLNSLTSEDLKTFQRLLSLQTDPIPVSRLEAADRTRTVDLMVQQYHAEGAKEVTEKILRTLNYNQLADDLQRNSSI